MESKEYREVAQGIVERVNDWYNDECGDFLYDDTMHPDYENLRDDSFARWVTDNATAGMDPKLNEEAVDKILNRAQELWEQGYGEKNPQAILDMFNNEEIANEDFITASWYYKPTGQWVSSSQLVELYHEAANEQ